MTVLALGFGIGANVAIFPVAMDLVQNAPLQVEPHLTSFSLSRIAGFLALTAGAIILVACTRIARPLLSRHFARKQDFLLLVFLGGIQGLGLANGWSILPVPQLSSALPVGEFRTFCFALLAIFISGLLASSPHSEETRVHEPNPLDQTAVILRSNETSLHYRGARSGAPITNHTAHA